MTALVLCLFLAPAGAAEISLPVGQSVVLEVPSEVARVAAGNPEVADAVAISGREVLVNARALGSASIVIWGKSGGRTMHKVTVTLDLAPLQRLLREAFPRETIEVRSSRDPIALTGSVSSQEVADKALALAAPLGKAAVSYLRVAAPAAEKQIVLRVKFAELDRNAASQLGANLISTGALNTPGRVTTGQFAAPSASELTGTIGGKVTGTSSTFRLSDALNVFAFRPDLNLAAVIRALETRGLLQVIAEPNLVAVSGKEASFLVGGEFPVPVVQGGANAGAISVQFREFGIRLSFLAAATPQGAIRMHVKPEVSSIDSANGVTVSGFSIPALTTRRMETHIELAPGQSLLIAGLLDERVTESLSRIPGLGSVPVLGVLFRSRQINKQRTELVVIVTPEYAAAGTPEMPKMPREFLPSGGPRS